MELKLRLRTLTACAVLAPGAASQQGGEITGFSALSAGRAGAGAAAGDSVLDAARNPAVIAFLFGDGPRQIGASATAEIVGRAVWAPGSDTDEKLGSFRNDTHVTGGPAWLGWASEVADGAFLGLTAMPHIAVDANLDRTTELNVGTPIRRQPLHLHNEILQLGVQPTFAWRTDDFAVGFGASFRYTESSLSSATDLDVRSTFRGAAPFGGGTWGQLLSGPPFNIKTMQTYYTGDAAANLTALMQLGALWKVREDTHLTAWYRSPSTSMDLEGEVVVNFNPELGPILNFYGLRGKGRYDIEVKNVHMPDQIGAAVSHYASATDRVHMDVIWTNWSRTFNGWNALLSNPTNGDFTTLVGGNGSTSTSLQMFWRDVLSVSLGYEHDFSREFTVRGGVGYASDPTAGSVAPGTHVFNTWHVALGASLWGDSGGGDWHFAVAAALPESLHTGQNEVLSDFSSDTLRAAFYTAIVGYTLEF